MRMRVFHLGLLVHELIQKLTIAVRRAGLDVSLGHRERLTESPAVRRRHDDQAGAGRPFDHREPLVGRKGALACHWVSLPVLQPYDGIGVPRPDSRYACAALVYG